MHFGHTSKPHQVVINVGGHKGGLQEVGPEGELLPAAQRDAQQGQRGEVYAALHRGVAMQRLSARSAGVWATQGKEATRCEANSRGAACCLLEQNSG